MAGFTLTCTIASSPLWDRVQLKVESERKSVVPFAQRIFMLTSQLQLICFQPKLAYSHFPAEPPLIANLML